MFGFRVKPFGDREAFKASFFDRSRVINATDRATRRVLSRFGAYVRTRDRSSQRAATSKRTMSEPGQPPLTHNRLLKDNTFFAYDESTRSVVEGPALLNKTMDGTPERLEYGGEGEIKRHGKEVRAWYRPRPHAVPAFEIELQRMPPLWRDEIK